jgi:hypothetical protein
MKKIIIILSVLALLVSNYGQVVANENDTISLPRINEQFISLFPDMVLGKYIESDEYSKREIPREMVVKFLPDFLDGEPYLAITMYAIGKILNHKGYDLLLCGWEYWRPDEDTYDNHTYGHQYLLMFKNGEPIPITLDNYKYTERQYFSMSYNYYGEGGEATGQMYFDTDTTIVSHSYASEQTSATGYSTPLISTREYRIALNINGELETIEANKQEFSSPFYDRNYLKEQNWDKIDDKGYNGQFPTKDNNWHLHTVNYYGNSSLTNPPVKAYLHIERINGELIPIFETYINDELIDRYLVGQPRNATQIEKDYSTRTEILKCPIIIKISDGDVELLPNGKFYLQTK